jgi:hypothetical protein
VRFERAFRAEVGFECGDVAAVGFEVLGWHDDDLSGQAVTESVDGRFLFAHFGFRTGGVP